MSKEKQIEEMVRLIETTCSERISEAGESILRCPFSYGCNECTAVALYNAGYRKQSGWISVEERLPEREGMYLVYTYKGAIKFGDFRSYYAKNDNPQFDYYVTHWMPLPEPPKGGAE